MQLTPEMIKVLKESEFFTSNDIEFWYRNLGIIGAALGVLDPFIKERNEFNLNP